ncbi:MAG: hypothetical protein G8345_06510 [Magnetococcales bacterium]|nr:hypothetical protein [Magnetococcales bacterium]NGZ26523.1 hypothetical protein [Magnetococcales bacterium]
MWLTLILAMGLRLWLAQPPNTSDELAFFHLAHGDFFSKEGIIDSRGRMVMLLWIRLFSLGLGDHWMGFYLAVYAGALLSCVAVGLFARAVMDQVGSLLFSLLWATSFIAIATESRLFVDVLGNGLAMLGLYLVLRAAGLTNRLAPVARPDYWVMAGGLLLWMAILVRETFFTHGVVALFILWLAQERRLLIQRLLMGMAAGLLFELILTGLAAGDPFLRYKILWDYPKQVSVAPIFQVYDWWAILTRYPRLLWYSQSAELILFLLAFFGVIRWWVTRAVDLSRIGLVGVAVTFGLLAAALVSLSPPVPLLRESNRYYLTAMPFLYWAATVFLLTIHQGVRRTWSNDRATGVVGLLLFIVLAINLHAARNQKELIRNGNDAPLALANHLQTLRSANHYSTLYLDDNLRRALTLYLPASKGWQYQDLRPPYEQDGFLLLDFDRLHYNITNYNYRYGNFDADFYRLVERYPILWRFPSPRQEWRELYQVGQKIRRTGGELPWLQWHPQPVGNKYILSPDKSLTTQGNATTFSNAILSGSPKQGILIQLRFRLKAQTKIGGVIGKLTLDKASTPILLGRAWSDQQEREVALWGWLEQPLTNFQLEVTPIKEGVEITQPRLFLLQSVAADLPSVAGGNKP